MKIFTVFSNVRHLLLNQRYKIAFIGVFTSPAVLDFESAPENRQKLFQGAMH